MSPSRGGSVLIRRASRIERAASLAHARTRHKRRTHVLGPADGGGVDEATLQVAVPEETVVRLRAGEPRGRVSILCSEVDETMSPLVSRGETP